MSIFNTVPPQELTSQVVTLEPGEVVILTFGDEVDLEGELSLNGKRLLRIRLIPFKVKCYVKHLVFLYVISFLPR